MGNSQITTEEQTVSKTKNEIIKEAKRIEEALLFSSKGHFSASQVWSKFHLIIGIPTVILSAIASASALSQFDNDHKVAGLLAIIVAALTGLMTFLNPNEKANNHLNAGNSYDSLMNSVRIFWSIDCWRDESKQVLTERLKYFSEQKSKLNHSCPQIPGWAYGMAKRGIAKGEGAYTVDKIE